MSDTNENPEEFKIQAIDADKPTPFVISFDHFVAGVSQAFLMANIVCPGFSDMSEHEKVQALVNGTLAGLISIVMSKMKEGNENKASEYVSNCIAPASVNAKNLLDEWKRQISQQVRNHDGCKSDIKLN